MSAYENIRSILHSYIYLGFAVLTAQAHVPYIENKDYSAAPLCGKRFN